MNIFVEGGRKVSVLVLMEVSKKQSYIFKSNKLKENIGASMIIRYVTEDLPKTFIEEFQGKKILEGGGKSIYKFPTEDKGRKFVEKLSYEILERYSELEMFFVTVPFENQKDNIVLKIDEAYKKLGRKKSKRLSCYYQMSFGMEKTCYSTGMPAVYLEQEERYLFAGDRKETLISEEIRGKLRANAEMQDNLGEFTADQRVIKDIDSIVDSGDKSYIAIIHIDGNKMGKKFDEIKEKYLKSNIIDLAKHNQAYVEEMGNFSRAIDAVYKIAFKNMCERYKAEKGETRIRPIILAGDDVCFIAGAKDSIWLCKVFLEELEKQHVMGWKLYACAGIAIVKAGYPFSRAYELAEELCQNCKDTIVKQNLEDTNMIDWHIVQGELKGNLHQIREGYKIDSNCTLTLRPLFAADNYKDRINHYDNFKEILNSISKGKNPIPRSKLKTLRSKYKEGIEATRIYMEVNGLEKEGQQSVTNKLDMAGSFKCEYGFYKLHDQYSATHYDAIEIVDLVETL